MSSMNKMGLYSADFAELVRSVESSSDFEKQLAGSIRNLPGAVKGFW
jgi:hypothetical protein